jgi:hypothetical protein
MDTRRETRTGTRLKIAGTIDGNTINVRGTAGIQRTIGVGRGIVIDGGMTRRTKGTAA